MLNADELVGIWITNNVFGQSEEMLVLMPGGNGAIDYYNPGYAGHDEFRWELIDGGANMKFTPAIWADDTQSISIYVDSRGRRVLKLGKNYKLYFTQQRTSDYTPPKD